MENSEIITIIISLIAIIISIVTYIQNSKIQKRQIRIEKLEELLEIIHSLNGDYQYFEDTLFFKNSVLTKNPETIDESEVDRYTKQVYTLTKMTDDIDLRNKLSRLYVLSNSYLPKSKLKDKIGVFIALYTSIVENTINFPNKNIKLPFNKYPKKWEFLEFTDEIKNEIVEEMDLGYKDNISYKNNYETEFKKRFKLE